jgi:L-fuculose-phosphate aldolase
MIGEPLRVAHMDTTMFHEDCAYLPQWPGVPLANEEGRIISGALGTKSSILLAHHGLLTVGASIEKATYLAVAFENAAKLQMLARSAGDIKEIPAPLAAEAHEFMTKPSIVNATFDYWARQVLQEDPRILD